jgi:transposase-like protein
MKFARTSLLYSLLVFFQACGPTQADLNEEKRVEILALHDEVMPKLGQLKSLEKKALQQLSELRDQLDVDSDRVRSLEELAAELNRAYEEMFVWMRQYKVDEEGQTPEEVKIYLEEQILSVTEVNRDIKAALAKGDSLLAD